MKNSIFRLLALMFVISLTLTNQTSAEMKVYRDDVNHFSIKLLEGTRVFDEDLSSYGKNFVMLAAKKGGIISHSNIPMTMILVDSVEFEQASDDLLRELGEKYEQIMGNGVQNMEWIRVETKEIYGLKQFNSLFVKSLVMTSGGKKNIYAHCYHFIFGENHKLYQIFYITPAENEQKYKSQVFESAQSFTLDR